MHKGKRNKYSVQKRGANNAQANSECSAFVRPVAHILSAVAVACLEIATRHPVMTLIRVGGFADLLTVVFVVSIA